jgi:pimeloyl-ACP methyl ester carboxylesterase
MLLIALLLLGGPASATFGGCTDGITCATLTANDLEFHCRFAGAQSATAPSVLLLHGFPEWSDMYMPLMRYMADAGVHSVACNQRGYSPGARPPLQTDYNYNTLKSDVFALATAANFSKFHLVGHDHGACLGWVTSASDEGMHRILSYTALSIPHVNAFSEGLFGPNADIKQQVASQYFSMFTMNNSAKLDDFFLFTTMGKTSSDATSDTFATSDDFQKSLWWYNGAYDAGYFALPPTFSATELLLKYGNPAMASLRKLFPGSAAAIAHPEGIPQTTLVANVTMPALYVCGKKDTAILCNRPFALKTAEFCPAGYNYLEVDCGHDVLAKGAGDGCASDTEVEKVNAAILAHIKNATA